jgi:two-component system OmpR family response regulator
MNLEEQVDVVVADGWPSSSEMLSSVVRRSGHTVAAAGDAAAVVRLVEAKQPGVVLIDTGIGAVDGWSIVQPVRDACVQAILIAVGPDDEDAKVQALLRGCDDYLVKPVPHHELAVRVGAWLRLLRRLGAPRTDEVYDDGLIRLHTGLRRVEVNGREVSLTPLEFRLMTALVQNRDRVVSRDELQEATWHGAAPSGGDHVKLYVHYLRRKLHEHTPEELIQTVRGFGYRWIGRESEERNGNGEVRGLRADVAV